MIVLTDLQPKRVASHGVTTVAKMEARTFRYC